MPDITGFRLRVEDIDFVTGLSRPECVIAEHDGTLWISDNRASVTRIGPEGEHQRIGSMGGEPNGLAMDRKGVLYVANIGDGKIYRMERDGRHEVILAAFEGRPLGAANFVYVDAQDRLWATFSTVTEPRIEAVKRPIPDGYILRRDAEGWKRVADGICFTNEIRIDAAGKWLYVAETRRGGVVRQPILADGSLGAREDFGPVPLLPEGLVDGIAFDAAGNLWVTEVKHNALIAITPEGRAHEIFRDPEGKILLFPTCVTFGGPDLRTVWVGSIRTDRVARFRSPIAGEPMRHWER